MDGSAPDLVLTKTGCNFCDQARKTLWENEFLKPQWNLDLADLKKQKGKYNCLIGLSGGADSSTVLDWAISEGLKPLCFSVDNGWQHPKAQENIMRLVEGPTPVPYYRYTINLDRFRSLQAAFLRAGLINQEIPTDHILYATTYEMADKYGIKYILSGGNAATESIMPYSWSYPARDLTHLKDVYRKMTGKKLKGLPTLGLLKFNYCRWIKGIKILYPLDFIGYDRAKAIRNLEKYGWQDYGEKHEESVYTHWYQNFYLFEKYGIDKRKAHYSSLIVSGQMTRKEALFKLQACPVYPYLGLEQKALKYKKRNHEDFKTDKWYDRIANLLR